MQNADLNVITREAGIGRQLKDLRDKGYIPANVYGPGVKNVSCAFSEREVRLAFNNDFSANKILTLKSDNKDLNGKQVFLKSFERHPVSWKLIHADLYEVNMKLPVTISLPIRFVGTPTGVKDSGGIFQVLRRSILVKALVKDLPEAIDVDITALPLGGSIHIGDVKFSEAIKVLDSAKFTLAAVVEAEKEEVVQAVAAPAEGAAGTGAAAAPATGAAAPAADAKAEGKK